MTYTVEELSNIIYNNDKLWEEMKDLQYIGAEKRDDNIIEVTVIEPVRGLNKLKECLKSLKATQGWESLDIPNYKPYESDPEDQPYAVRFWYLCNNIEDDPITDTIVVDVMRGGDYFLSSGVVEDED